MAWYREWFGEEYLELYAHRDAGEAAANVGAVLDLVGGDEPRAVLDLACGTGRYTRALRAAGLRTLGLDLSLTLLARSPGLPRVAGDMCRLPFDDSTFDWVLNFFTSFGYFEDEADNRRVLGEVARILTVGGLFLLDLFNLDHVLATLEPHEALELDGRRVEIERWYDPESRRMNKRIRLPDEPAESWGGRSKSFLESVRAYRRDEVVEALDDAGLAVERILGDFRGEPFHRDSERLIVLGRRR
ncbi:MAG: class I SAM-dependent methyltransferase [Thermoanaerobaculia bacterium]